MDLNTFVSSLELPVNDTSETSQKKSYVHRIIFYCRYQEEPTINWNYESSH